MWLLCVQQPDDAGGDAGVFQVQTDPVSEEDRTGYPAGIDGWPGPDGGLTSGAEDHLQDLRGGGVSDPCVEGQRRSVVGQVYQQLHHRGDLPPAGGDVPSAAAKSGGADGGEADGIFFYGARDGRFAPVEAGVYQSADRGHVVPEFAYGEGVHREDLQKAGGQWTECGDQ